MALKEHHPSCRESDKDLVWHCSQCGLNESADETEIISKFVSEVERRAENKMLITHRLEGAHYAAMKEFLNELTINGASAK